MMVIGETLSTFFLRGKVSRKKSVNIFRSNKEISGGRKLLIDKVFNKGEILPEVGHKKKNTLKLVNILYKNTSSNHEYRTSRLKNK